MWRWSILLLILPLIGCDAIALDDSERAVIGGRVVASGEFSNVVALLDGTQPLCTGTLIAPDAVLTAAHCVDPNFGVSRPNVTFGNDARPIASPPFVTSSDSAPHPSFDINRTPGAGVSEFFDVGVVILSEPVTGVTPAALPSVQEADNNLVPGAQVDLVGYGLRVDDPNTDQVGEKAAGVATITAVGDNELQVSMPGEQQNCSGDSGGPAFIEVSGGGTRLVGIVSRSADGEAACDSGGIDTRVDAYLDFIEDITGATGGGGGGGGDGDGDGDGDGQGGGGGSTGDANDGGCSTSGSPGASGLLWLIALIAIRRRRR